MTAYIHNAVHTIENQEAFAVDDLSQAFTGQPSDYRRTPRMQLDIPSAG